MSKITKANYKAMTDTPGKIQLIAANSMYETVISDSLQSLYKSGSRVKAQFSFNANKLNVHPLTYVFLVIGGDITGSYLLKPSITDITAVRALNVEWEI